MLKNLERTFKPLIYKLLMRTAGKKQNPGALILNPGSRILIIRLNRIGDALVTTPFIKYVKSVTGCSIDILASTYNHFIFENNPDVSKVIVFEKSYAFMRKLITEVNTSGYTAVFDLHDDVSTTVSYLLAKFRIPHIIGLKKDNSILYTFTAERLNSESTHVIDRLLHIAEAAGVKGERTDVNVVYRVKENSEKRALKVLEERFTEKKFLLGVNISAGSMARFWGVKNIRELLRKLEAYNINVLLMSSTRDLSLAFEIQPDKKKVFYTPDFDEFAAMVKQLDMIFTPDTSTVHIASAFRVPVFGLYVKYMTDDMIWSPYRSDFETIVTLEPNLDNVTFEDVENKFLPFLEKYLNG